VTLKYRQGPPARQVQFSLHVSNRAPEAHFVAYSPPLIYQVAHLPLRPVSAHGIGTLRWLHTIGILQSEESTHEPLIRAPWRFGAAGVAGRPGLGAAGALIPDHRGRAQRARTRFEAGRRAQVESRCSTGSSTRTLRCLPGGHALR